MPIAVVLLVLSGLFGMHGLSDHGAGHHATVAAAVHDGGSHHAADGDGAHPAGLAGLCVAILLSGVLLLALLLARGARRRGWAAPLLARVAAPVPRGRDPDPPTPLLLSIARC